MPDKAHRINRFFGGITDNDRDKRPGVFVNMEEVDIFHSKSRIRPTTILATDEIIAGVVNGYDVNDNDDLFAHGDTAGNARIYRKPSAGADSPSVWATFKDVGVTRNAQSPLKWHQYHMDIDSITRSSTTATLTTSSAHGLTTGDEVTIKFADESNFNTTTTIIVTTTTAFKYTVSDTGVTTEANPTAVNVFVSYLYVVTGTNQLRRIHHKQGTTGTADRATTEMVLPDSASNTRIAMFRAFNELHILAGQYVSTVDEDGVFIAKAFVLPDGWEGVSMALSGVHAGILAKSLQENLSESKIFFWDLTSTTGVIDEISIPMGGPQIVFNYKGNLFSVNAQNAKLKVFLATAGGGQKVTGMSLDNIPAETAAQAIVPDATKFEFEDTICFGIHRTSKSGIYQFGQFDDESPFAILLFKNLEGQAKTNPVHAAIGIGPNMYASFENEAAAKVDAKLEGNKTPTFSSNARIETVYVDDSIPETLKPWKGFMVITEPVPDSCNIIVDSKTDDTSSDYGDPKTLTNADDQKDSGATADTYWKRDITSKIGRASQWRIRFTSNSTTARPTLISFAPISGEEHIYG